DPRLNGESIAQVFRSVGGQIRQSWCGPCFGQGPDALTQGQRAITSFNRNWTNRMGVGGEGYLASPAVVAASALLGYMGPPSTLAQPRRLQGAEPRPDSQAPSCAPGTPPLARNAVLWNPSRWKLPAMTCAIVPVRAMIARMKWEVAVAECTEKPRSRTSAGTWMNPPPTPSTLET